MAHPDGLPASEQPDAGTLLAHAFDVHEWGVPVKEHPIIFSGPMVRALLDGRKTQTRRIAGKYKPAAHANDEDLIWKPSPWTKVQPGDRLWVRENFCPDAPIDGDEAWNDGPLSDIEWAGCGRPLFGIPKKFQTPEHVIYAASWDGGDLRWSPSIHMPRWAARILLEVTGVREERLQDISENDSLSEGVVRGAEGEFFGAQGFMGCASARDAFWEIWESVNGPGSWEENPLVVAIEFKRVQ